MVELQSKHFDEPDEVVSLPGLDGQIVVLGELYVGRFVHHPGWCWSKDVKPLVGTPSCQYHHPGVALSRRGEGGGLLMRRIVVSETRYPACQLLRGEDGGCH